MEIKGSIKIIEFSFEKNLYYVSTGEYLTVDEIIARSKEGYKMYFSGEFALDVLREFDKDKSPASLKSRDAN